MTIDLAMDLQKLDVGSLIMGAQPGGDPQLHHVGYTMISKWLITKCSKTPTAKDINEASSQLNYKP